MRAKKKIEYAIRILLVAMLVQCGIAQNKLAASDTLIKQTQPPQQFSLDDIKKGKAFAVQYCGSCHQLPDPSLLNKAVWRNAVLPAMGQYYGVNPAFTAQRGRMRAINTQAIDPIKWMQINAYYISKAPEHMPATDRAEPVHQLPFFEVMPTPAEWVSTRAFTSYVKIDTSVVPHRLLVNDGLANKFIVLNDKIKTLNAVNLNTTLVNLLFRPNKVYATSIGFNLVPNDLKTGDISEITVGQNGAFSNTDIPLFNNLNRPLSVDIVDLNQDRKPDYLIAQFGTATGKLSWFEKNGGITKEHLLREKPGCLKTVINYNNRSKHPDIWALFAQGDEGIFLYANQGKGVFKEKRVLTFAPSFGSISFDLVDFNGDGFNDIIYVCGDNGDFSQILKPYHGVYIYLNDGKNNFTQKFFYPIHGCSKAIARDFDGDGDLDIATVSEYPAGKTPWEAFIYLENKGNLNFQAYTLPPDIPFTRGMTMDAADFDGDGKCDLLLGAGFAASDLNGTDKQPLFMVLKNTGFVNIR